MVSTYKYLGTLITNDGKIEPEIVNRTGDAIRIHYTAMNYMRKIVGKTKMDRIRNEIIQ